MLSYGVERLTTSRRALAIITILYFIAVLTSISAMEMLAAVLAVWVFFIVLYHRFRNGQWAMSTTTGLEWPFLGLASTVLIGLLLNPDSQTGSWNFEPLGHLTWIPLLYALTYTFRLRFPHGKSLLAVFGVALLVSTYAVVQALWGVDLIRGASKLHSFGSYFRSTGLFNNPMTYAHSYGLLFFLPLAVVFTRKKKGLWFVFSLLVLAALGFSILTSQTRGVWIGVAAGTLVSAFCVSNRLFLMTSGLSLAGVLGVISWSTTFRERLFTIVDMSFNNNSTRLELWRTNWTIFTDHPLFGAGYTQNVALLPSYYERLQIDSEFFSHAHNTYLHFLAGTGAFGLLFYLAIVGFLFYKTLRLYRDLPVGSTEKMLVLAALGAQVAFHIGGLTECNFEDSEVNHMLMIYFAIVLSLETRWSEHVGTLTGHAAAKPGHFT